VGISVSTRRSVEGRSMYRVLRDQSHAKEEYDVITFTSSGDWGFPESPANRLMTGQQGLGITASELDSRTR